MEILYNTKTIDALSPEEKVAYYFSQCKIPSMHKARWNQFTEDKFVTGLCKDGTKSLQNVTTPRPLCIQILNKIEEFIGLPMKFWEGKRILCLNLEFYDVLYEREVMLLNSVSLISDNKHKCKFAELGYNRTTDDIVTFGNFLTFEDEMKFDIVIGNPPYQSCNEGEKKTKAIWPKFVEKSFDLCKKNGHVALIHPSGWRDVDGAFKDTQELLKNKQIDYLEMHDEKDGMKTFGATTTYDWYVAKNCENKKETTIKCQDGSIVKHNISKMEFIPNGMFDEIEKLVAKDGEEKVEIIYSRSAYGSDKGNMSKDKSEEFCHPCVYTTQKDGTINFWYSSTKENGHFGNPKVFWSNGAASSVHCDKNGDYGLTQFSYGISDSIENLEDIKKAMENEKFISIMNVSALGKSHKYNRKIIAQFRKDFWKEFID